MQKLVVLIFSLVLLLGQPQNKIDSKSAPDLVVRKFSWSRYRQVPLPRNGADEINTESRQLALNDGIENRNSMMENRNSIENKSRAMKDYEDSVARESRRPNLDNAFRYSVELRNTGAKVIKGVYFDYQIIDPSDPENPSHRQFACEVTIKPESTQTLEAFTTSPPRRVISATGNTRGLSEKVVINRLEYSDKGFWERADWHGPDPLPGGIYPHGRCRLF